MTMTVAYPGREGAHSAAAGAVLFPDAELAPLPSFVAVVDAVAAGEHAFGVLPIESSLAGSVAESHDLLVASNLMIVREAVLPIRHCLVGLPGTDVDAIRVVRSHPVALDQCRLLLARMPDAVTVAAATTANAAQAVAEAGIVTEVAIASDRAATLHGLEVLMDDVGDRAAFTRFVALAAHGRVDRGPDWRVAFSFVTNHSPGALHAAIEPFARRGVDLLQLVSRPLPETVWRYRFDAVLAGHPLDAAVRETLAEARERTRMLRVLGSYPAA